MNSNFEGVKEQEREKKKKKKKIGQAYLRRNIGHGNNYEALKDHPSSTITLKIVLKLTDQSFWLTISFTFLIFTIYEWLSILFSFHKLILLI